MYFWRIEELKARLAHGPLSEREVLPYLVLFAAIAYVAPFFPAESMNVWDYLGASWAAALAVGGTLYAFRRNGGRAGANFVQHYLAIGWVVGVRWVVFLAALFVVYLFLVDPPQETTWHEALFFCIAELILWERIAHHIGDLAATTGLYPDRGTNGPRGAPPQGR